MPDVRRRRPVPASSPAEQQKGRLALRTASRYFAAVLLVAATLPANSRGIGSAPGRDAGNIRQNETARRMRWLQFCLDAYRSEHGKYPVSLRLAATALYTEHASDYLHDGWGRDWLYYRTSSTFFVGSLGKDGLPDGSASNEESENCDITMINGEFARLPDEVPQW
jgi:hypothetical protein